MRMIHGGEIYDKKIEYDFSVNLNPCPCPESVKQAIIKAADRTEYYPDIYQRSFRNAVAAAENLKPENILGTNGASELLTSLIRYLEPEKVLLPEPSFFGYRHALNMLKNCSVESYCITEDNDFILDEGILNKITCETDVLILANPNNPTGKCIDDPLLEDIVKKCADTGTALIVDECFLNISTSGVSIKRFIEKVPRIFVVDSYTKLFSLPGVRIGYCMAGEEDIRNLRQYLPEWNLSVFAEKAGIAGAEALKNTDFLNDSLEIIQKERDELYKGLQSTGVRYFESDSVFILIKSDKDLYNSLLKRGVLIRDCSNFNRISKGLYRIAVKDPESNRALIQELKRI